jgi:hypothetical protein
MSRRLQLVVGDIMAQYLYDQQLTQKLPREGIALHVLALQ